MASSEGDTMRNTQPDNGDLDIVITSVQKSNLEALKLLNSVIFPIKYSDQVYKDCMQFPQLTFLAYHDDTLVGGVMGRLEMRQGKEGTRLYIASLGVLAPYRGYKVGSRLLQHCLAGVADDPMIGVAAVHMQVGNDDAQRFYERHGFQVVETISNYYRTLNPPDALVLMRPLR